MPKSPHLLLAGANVRKLRNNLSNILDRSALDAIENEIRLNTRQLYVLGRSHFLFAKRQNNRDWRQKVSRLYYGAYNVSRAVRLSFSGEYSTEVTDHKKIETLPDDFPEKNTYANRLGVLREDRNLCDYDHVATRADLVSTLEDAEDLVEKFLGEARKYLKARGIAT